MDRRELGRFGKFLLAGGVAAAVNYGSRFLFSVWLPFAAAVTLAFFVGLVTGFVLMRHFVFDAAGASAGGQAVRYVAINLIALLLTVGISVLGADLLAAYMTRSVAQAIAHGVGVAFPVITSYAGHRLVTFANAR